MVHESVARDVEDVGVRVDGEDLLADGLEEVSFAEADAAVDEEWVVGCAGLVGDGDRSCVSELVVRASDEVFE